MRVSKPGFADARLSREILYLMAMLYKVSPAWIVCKKGVAVGRSGSAVESGGVGEIWSGVLVVD
jgi:hypothetical protein